MGIVSIDANNITVSAPSVNHLSGFIDYLQSINVSTIVVLKETDRELYDKVFSDLIEKHLLKLSIENNYFTLYTIQ